MDKACGQMGDPNVSAKHYGYWGKAHQDGSEALTYHLLVYHSLDVAGVGYTLLERDQLLLGRLERTSGLSAETLVPLVGFLFAIHDIGKFSARFQNLRPDVLDILQPDRRCRQGYTVKHDEMGYWLWDQILLPDLHARGRLAIHADDLMDCRDLLAPLARAVLGHHGIPPTPNPNSFDCFELEDKEAAISFTSSLAELFEIGGRALIPVEPFEQREAGHKRLSWMLAGMCVLSDWLGSDSRRFPHMTDRIPFDDYWEDVALPRAREAVDRSGVLPPRPKAVQGFEELLPHLGGSTLTPLQEHAATADLPEGPQLHIYEDATGSGKTEAAILCAHRLLQAERGKGIFVALPTMATANAMYARMATVYRNLFAGSILPSLTLAHGSRHLSRAFLQSIELEGIPRGPRSARDSAEATCSSWLADNKKKAMLAATGVGTVDQALLAVLTSKHQSLRLFGLGRGVLIVDEVHSYDFYMHSLLCTLLTFQAAQGGSAILLSATLPKGTRDALSKAFAEGLGGPHRELSGMGYPLATTVACDYALEVPVGYREATQHVPVELLHERSQVEDVVAQAASVGGCVLWIRNTVGDALQARQDLIESERVPKSDILLYHARFAACDRLRIEEEVLSTFGPKSQADDRRGKVVIATQVAEQSLDVDFDVLVTDLAPIDLVLQRAGRWRRHKRPDRPRGLPDSLYVYSPPTDGMPDFNWYRSMFPSAAYVYPFQSKLWLTARLLGAQGGYAMPDDARRLIEGVYGGESEDAPESLEAADAKAEGEAKARMTMAGINGLSLAQGYGGGDIAWREDEVSPTRLGEPTVRLRLARWDGKRLTPWSEYSSPALSWSMSEVSVPEWRASGGAVFSDRALEDALRAATEAMPDGCRWSLLVPLVPTDGGLWQATVLRRDGKESVLTYSSDSGVSWE